MATLLDDGNRVIRPSSPPQTPSRRRENASSKAPHCRMCGSSLTKESKSIKFNESTIQNSDSHVFSRVLTIAINRMCTIVKEMVEEKKLLIEDKDAMADIWENACLMKSTIKYLLHEMYDDGKDRTPGCCNDDNDSNRSVLIHEEEEEEATEEEEEEAYMVDGDDDINYCTIMISRGLIGGITTMSFIAEDRSEAKKVLLADDKEALTDMLDIVRMVKMLV